MKPFVFRDDTGPKWARWAVWMAGKKIDHFAHWYAAASHAVYVARNPRVMEDLA